MEPLCEFCFYFKFLSILLSLSSGPRSWLVLVFGCRGHWGLLWYGMHFFGEVLPTPSPSDQIMATWLPWQFGQHVMLTKSGADGKGAWTRINCGPSSKATLSENIIVHSLIPH